MFLNHLDYFQKTPLGSRPNTKPKDHGTLITHNRWFTLFHQVWGLAWIEIPWNNIWLRARSHMTSHYTWGSVTTLHGDFGGVLGRPLDTLLGSHNLLVTALGSLAHGPECIQNCLPRHWTSSFDWFWRKNSWDQTHVTSFSYKHWTCQPVRIAST